MNDSNLETLLRSWTPRPPSAEIKRRLFNPGPALMPGPARREHWNWLAPLVAGGAAVLMFLALSHREAGEGGTRLIPGTFGAMVLSNVLASGSGSNGSNPLTRCS